MLGWSQRELARELDISLSAWQGYEAGRSVPGGQVLLTLAARGISGDWLLTGEGQPLRAKGPPQNEPNPHTEEVSPSLDVQPQVARAQQQQLWRILELTQHSGNTPLSVSDITELLAKSGEARPLTEVAANCRLLAVEGLLVESQSDATPVYTLRDVATLRPIHDADRLAAALQVEQVIHSQILPALMRRNRSGYLGTIVCHLHPGDEVTLVDGLREVISARSREIKPGEGRLVHFILGMGVDKNSLSTP